MCVCVLLDLSYGKFKSIFTISMPSLEIKILSIIVRLEQFQYIEHCSMALYLSNAC